MRDQVVTPRTNSRSGDRMRSGGISQKPARRSAGSRANGSRLKTVLSYMPLVGKVLLAVITGVLIFAGYRAAASASFFEARNLDISGASRVSVEQVKAAVRRTASQTGVWRADLDAISSEVEKLPWVRDAIVSRVLPDGFRVRVVERVPRAVVRNAAGRFVWVDDDAVTLSQMLPTDAMPPFFIRGWDESGSGDARTENRDRIQRYLEMTREWGTLGISERVSEVNLGDPHDVRALLAGDDAHIEVRLGEKNFGGRLQKALKVLDEQRSTPLGPFITYLVANQDGQITVGRSANAPALADQIATPPVGDQADVSVVKTEGRPTPPAKANGTRREREDDRRKKDVQANKEQRDKPSRETTSETRPRRVG